MPPARALGAPRCGGARAAQQAGVLGAAGGVLVDQDRPAELLLRAGRRAAAWTGAALGLALALGFWGDWLDRMRLLSQPVLFAGLQVASLGGVALGLAAVWPRSAGTRRRAVFAVAGLLAWRVSYFPIMVFSGHMAAVAEWLLASFLLPIVIYPVYLLAAAILHSVAAVAATFLAAPSPRWSRGARRARWLLVPPFAVAVMVSFNAWSDLHPLPDTTVELDRPLEHPHTPKGNPYLTALAEPGYNVNQRVTLLAAGLTYDTIPDAPWATAVKSALEELFRRHPHASTSERVGEHYLAYHSAQAWIGCRRLADCPLPP